MPRVDGVFQLLPGTYGEPDTSIKSVPYNAQLDDFVNDANGVRPIAYGGTGGATAAAARTALGVPTGTSGAVIPFLNGANTWGANQTIANNAPNLILNEVDVGAGVTSRIVVSAGIMTIRNDETGAASGYISFQTGSSLNLAGVMPGGLFYGAAYYTDASAYSSGASYNGDGVAINYAAGSSVFSKAAAATIVVNRNAASGEVVSIRRAASGVGSISVSGTTTAFNTSSDVRLKEDFLPIDPSAIDGVDVYDFLWKDTSERGYGVVAQELFEVIPQAVYRGEITEENPDPMWSVDYSKLVPFLVASVKDLRARLAALETD